MKLKLFQVDLYLSHKVTANIISRDKSALQKPIICHIFCTSITMFSARKGISAKNVIFKVVNGI